MEKYSSMSQIFDSPIEEVAKELEKLTYGELTSFKKMLELQYQELEYTKNELQKLEERHKASHAIEGLYKLMQKAEDIATIVEELKRQKEVKL